MSVFIDGLGFAIPLYLDIPFFIPLCSLGLGIAMIGLISTMIWGKN